MSSMAQTLQAKIDSRLAKIKNLDEVIVRERQSLKLLRDQLADHEVAMADRVDAGTDNVRWTTWAESRLAGMQMQLEFGLRRIDNILGTIVHHEQEVKDLRSQSGETSGRRYVARVSNLERQRRLESPDFQKEVASNLVKTVAAIEGRKVKKGKTRRMYVAKGERKKSANTQQPAKKEKQQKNEKRGRKAA